MFWSDWSLCPPELVTNSFLESLLAMMLKGNCIGTGAKLTVCVTVLLAVLMIDTVASVEFVTDAWLPA